MLREQSWPDPRAGKQEAVGNKLTPWHLPGGQAHFLVDKGPNDSPLQRKHRQWRYDTALGVFGVSPGHTSSAHQD